MVIKIKFVPKDKTAVEFVKFAMERWGWKFGGSYSVTDSLGEVLLTKFPDAFEKIK